MEPELFSDEPLLFDSLELLDFSLELLFSEPLSDELFSEELVELLAASRLSVR